MGGACVAGSTLTSKVSSAISNINNGDNGSSSGSSKSYEKSNSFAEWMVVPTTIEARKKFMDDYTLLPDSPDGYLDLRLMLDEPMSMQALSRYAKTCGEQDILACWISIQSLKVSTARTIRLSLAEEVYYEYVDHIAPFFIAFIEEEERAAYKADLENYKFSKEILPLDFYLKLQMKCFQRIYDNVFEPFKRSKDFLALSGRLYNKYNIVVPQDFLYLKKLGEGGYGFVCDVMKTSTQTHYAMKLQRKQQMLQSYRLDPWKVLLERRALTACHHPFINAILYAFQTEHLAIMVLSLSRAGDLQSATLASPGNKLDLARARFYIAEVVLALGYLHSMGYMYRDLKPNNILLQEDGHIQLVDMGGSVDVEHDEQSHHDESRRLLPLYRKSLKTRASVVLQPREGLDVVDEEFTISENHGFAQEGNVGQDTPSGELKRKFSIMGTLIYMAPEMVVMIHQMRDERKGYTNAVDWWSLGVTLYKLIVGSKPFPDHSPLGLIEMEPHLADIYREYMDVIELERLFHNVYYPSFLPDEAIDFMNACLQVDETKRLGYGADGVDAIKGHPFFNGIDFDMLELKRVKPPYIPVIDDSPTTIEKSTTASVFKKKNSSSRDVIPEVATLLPDLNVMEMPFEDFMMYQNKLDWITGQAPTAEEQAYFSEWNYIAPDVMRIEAGLSQVRRQYDKSPKAQKIIGEKHLSSEKRLRKTPTRNGSFSEALSSVIFGGESYKSESSMSLRSPKAAKSHSTRGAAPIISVVSNA